MNELHPGSQSMINLRATGELLGMLATFCFTLQYAPQAIQNFQRKSTHGFSSTGIIIKLVGAAFLMVNAYLTGETTSVVLYGVFNVIQHSIFMWQFSIYQHDYKFLLWLLFPMIPYMLGNVMPSTIALTNSIKPGAQIFSHIPQLWVCYNLKTAQGVSLKTQHLNMIGGVAGLIMCFIIEPKSIMTYFLYINSMFQAISLYLVAIVYDNYSFCFTVPKSKAPRTSELLLSKKEEIEPMLGDANV
eukprot:CAMPEP_0197036060 /NCGR_PEP_ID=MMETSP1384-20130603/13673_1 /TAXON_ID=29189 /ORGANISM="Ammonia sp." /LENGTH=243 /DNA_ID=CAMNT_0042466189 /DNA_START=115 /DNA_END=846 /DNA_ORIENTATION=-